MVHLFGTLLPLIIFLAVPLSAGIVLALPNTVGLELAFLIFYVPLTLAYGTNPYKSTKKWDQEFVQKGYESIIHEFRTIRIIFFILILFLIIDIILFIGGYVSWSPGLRDHADNLPFIVFSTYLVLSAIGTGLQILSCKGFLYNRIRPKR